jgi:hypothetical protein
VLTREWCGKSKSKALKTSDQLNEQEQNRWTLYDLFARVTMPKITLRLILLSAVHKQKAPIWKQWSLVFDWFNSRACAEKLWSAWDSRAFSLCVEIWKIERLKKFEKLKFYDPNLILQYKVIFGLIFGAYFYVEAP